MKKLKKMNLDIEFVIDLHSQNGCVIDITSKNVNKYEATKFIADREQIKIKDVYAVGDNLNDIKMIKKVGHGFAVANACSEVKEVAKEITTSNDELGVEKILEKLV